MNLVSETNVIVCFHTYSTLLSNKTNTKNLNIASFGMNFLPHSSTASSVSSSASSIAVMSARALSSVSSYSA